LALDLDQLSAFVGVVRSGSFTAAAELRGEDKAHVSRLVSRLELSLGAQLLTRTTRSLTLTEIGRNIFERAVGILGAAEEVEAVAADAKGEPSGTLKLTCGEEFGLFVVSRWVIAYQQHFPAVRVEADLTNRVIDLVHEGFDCAIRVGQLPDSSLSAKKLGEITYALYASPDYLAARGLPTHPDELNRHDWLRLSINATQPLKLVNRRETMEIATSPRLLVNNNAFLREAAAAGLGIALLPQFQAAALVAQGHLQTIMPGWSRPPVPVHAVFPSTRFLAPKVRAFVDLARDRFAVALLEK
jgi:LysR family transcriptional regulator, regulator for bpeEF and oprC